MTDRHPGRFGLSAVLPMPFTDDACREAVYVLDDLHADRVVLMGSTDGRFLGAPRFDDEASCLARLPNGGLLLPPDSTTIIHRDLLITLAARHRLPAVYPFRFFVASGGLMSYSIDFVDEYRQAASYVDRTTSPPISRCRRRPGSK